MGQDDLVVATGRNIFCHLAEAPAIDALISGIKRIPVAPKAFGIWQQTGRLG